MMWCSIEYCLFAAVPVLPFLRVSYIKGYIE